MKHLEINQHQAEALSDGATMLLMPIDEKYQKGMSTYKFINKELILIQAGDEFYCTDEDGCRIIGMRLFDCVEVEVKRVQDLSMTDGMNLTGLNWKDAGELGARDWLESQGIDYNLNPLVALIKIGDKAHGN